jgi:hypothetical protein
MELPVAKMLRVVQRQIRALQLGDLVRLWTYFCLGYVLLGETTAILSFTI